MTEVVMPQMGISTLEGKVTVWLKKEGDKVVKGESLFEIETDKATTEVEALSSGILQKILVPAGGVAKVTEPVAILAEEGEKIDGAQGKASDNGGTSRRRISPLARRMAASAGVAPEMLYRVTGTGLQGAINKADILRLLSEVKEQQPAPAVAPAPAAPQPVPLAQPSYSKPMAVAAAGSLPDQVIPLSRMRKIIAERMTLSTREAPQFWMEGEVKAGVLVELRESINQRLKAKGIGLSYTDFLIKAVASALRECPYMNVSYTGNGIAQKADINLGFAVALEDGLIVPVIRGADRKSLSQISEERRRLADDARKGALTERDLSGGTFTISNLGMFKVDRFQAIINPPETGILSVGRIRSCLELRAGQVVSTPVISLGLTIDHRSVDGAQGARFLEAIINRLEEPYLFLV
jgi:pyruvate dehydrogenase E2 component (dihydrolipoamide acetyltransferase)